MKKISLLFCAFFMIGICAFAQVDKMKDILNDETDQENLTLRFINALNGEAVADAAINIEGVGVLVTDIEGKVKFPRLEKDGSLLVEFRAEGFIPTDLIVEVVAGTIFNNRISVSPLMAMEYMRIIVDWGRKPDDLDAHFTKDEEYHISYRNMKVAEDGVAQLDRDDTDSFGPETITVKEIETDAHYEFWVQDFSNQSNDNSKKLSKSKAIVKVYGNNQLLHQITVPTGMRGNKWQVFTIDKGQINILNYVSSQN